MEIKNFFSILGWMMGPLLFTLVLGCAQFPLQTRTEIPEKPQANQTSQADKDVLEPSGTDLSKELEPYVPPRRAPRVGVILGPGMFNAYGHVGALKAFEENKIPIHAIAGLEWGSLPAALYANKGLVHDVEWKMLRLEQQDLPNKSFFSSRIRARDIETLKDFFDRVARGDNVHRSEVPFACPGFHVGRRQVLWQRQGSVAEVLARCMAFPPFFESASGFYADPWVVEEAAAHLKSRGAEIIIFINVLEGSPLFEQADQQHYLPEYLLWHEVARRLSEKNLEGVDHVVPIKLDQDIFNFENRRAHIQQGHRRAGPALQRLANQYQF